MPKQTPESMGREVGDAIATTIADGLERVLLKLAGAIADVREENERLRRDLDDLGRAHVQLDNAYRAHLRGSHGQDVG